MKSGLFGMAAAAVSCGMLRLLDIISPPHIMPWPAYAILTALGTIGWFKWYPRF